MCYSTSELKAWILSTHVADRIESTRDRFHKYGLVSNEPEEQHSYESGVRVPRRAIALNQPGRPCSSSSLQSTLTRRHTRRESRACNQARSRTFRHNSARSTPNHWSPLARSDSVGHCTELYESCRQCEVYTRVNPSNQSTQLPAEVNEGLESQSVLALPHEPPRTSDLRTSLSER